MSSGSVPSQATAVESHAPAMADGTAQARLLIEAAQSDPPPPRHSAPTPRHASLGATQRSRR